MKYLFLCLYALFLLSAPSFARAEACVDLSRQFGYEVRDLTEPQIKEIFGELLIVAGIDPREVMLCKGNLGDPLAASLELDQHYPNSIVALRAATIADLEPIAIKAWLAHELCHVKLALDNVAQPQSVNGNSFEQVMGNETRCDAMAVGWVGKDLMMKALREARAEAAAAGTNAFSAYGSQFYVRVMDRRILALEHLTD
jgi:hypothetical protein